jgi:hypothetical protein
MNSQIFLVRSARFFDLKAVAGAWLGPFSIISHQQLFTAILAPRQANPMTTRQSYRFGMLLTLSLLASFPTTGVCLAAKGGDGSGHGKPGGDDPPINAPVSYAVTPITLPGNSYRYYDHNNDAAIVGTIHDSPAGGQRAMVYLPSISTTQAFYLDDSALNVAGIPGNWHTRSAFGVNTDGNIVGSLERDGDTETNAFFLSGLGSATPALQQLDLVDLSADKEVAVKINDDGDIVVWSQKHDAVSGVTVDSLYVGNLGPTGGTLVDVVEIDFAAQGIANATIDHTSIKLSNRIGSDAIVTGSVHDGSESRIFRAHLDGGGVELAPNYTAADGSQQSWFDIEFDTLLQVDVNNDGDIAGAAQAVSASKGKPKSNIYGAVWPWESDEITPAASDDPFDSEWAWAAFNNDRDFLLYGPSAGNFDTLWHNNWSVANGAASIAGLIDADDPNRALFDNALELTDHTGDGWPVIIAHGSETIGRVDQNRLLLLHPALNPVATASSAAVPEPDTALLGLLVLVPLAIARWNCRKSS